MESVASWSRETAKDVGSRHKTRPTGQLGQGMPYLSTGTQAEATGLRSVSFWERWCTGVNDCCQS